MFPSKCLYPSITGDYRSKESSIACFFFFSFLDDPGLLFITWSVYPGKNKQNEARDDKCCWVGSCGRERDR